MFVALNVKSEYSFFESTIRVEAYLARAKEFGFTAVGLIDKNMHVAYQFITKAKAIGLRPIIGLEVAVKLSGADVRLSLIARDTRGYHNLLRLSTAVSLAETEKIELSALTDYFEGLSAIVPRVYVQNGLFDAICAVFTQEIFVAQEAGDNDEEMAENARPIAFAPVRYLAQEDGAILDVLKQVQLDASAAAVQDAAHAAFLRTPESYAHQFSGSAALENLERLTETIGYDLQETLALPRFDVTKDSGELLRAWSLSGLTESLSSGAEVYQTRLEYELSVIHTMGFDDYFLIVADLLRFAKSHAIYCGMGRGSAAGSLVAFALGITHIDPVAENLLFERFLNPERVAMPDIDIDMPDNKRGALLAYMQERWGAAHVAQILTFSTFGKRQALRDVSKVFGLTEPEIAAFTRLSGSRFGTLSQEYEKNQRFRAELLRDGMKKRIFELALKIEGMPRQTSTHASGVVLSSRPLVETTALMTGENLRLTQYDAHDVEALGMLKIDFLGLSYLGWLAEMVKLVQEKENVTIDPVAIALDDEKTLELFQKGDTEGIFQFERPAVKRFLRRLSPTKLDDIVATTSINRPGPSAFVENFIARRHGKEAVPSMDASIDDILAPTYGIMIFQEQVMLVAQRFAGFSLGRADLLRRAISKRQSKAEFEKLRADFVAGATALGRAPEKAHEIYDLIVRFAGFGFNRSHAVAYSALAFQIAYFKVHYPDAFYQAELGGYKRNQILEDILAHGYAPEAPNINRIPYHDKVSDGKLNLGLRAISGMPRDFAIWILDNRPFSDLMDFVKKVPANWKKADVIRPLIEIGAFDWTDSNRGKLLESLARLIDYTETFQLDLFGQTALVFSFSDAEDLTPTEKYQLERARLGVALTPHPLIAWQKRLANVITPLSALTENSQVTILVEISRVRQLTTKKNDRMAFVEASDGVRELTVVAFPETYQKIAHLLHHGEMVLFTGKVTVRNDDLQLQANRATPIVETSEKLWLQLENESRNTQLAAVLAQFPGSYPVVLHTLETHETRATTLFVEKSELLLRRLATLCKKAIYR
ncbi:MAG: DNA polymerase III subunit alpha [Streptococcaceae bacterium]|jgi:DNA polymerase-3 subunit alpha|nr:DNA polymerase III subunit alpha [Streptococcaceae bacterium]